jgi:hypothetical protein
MGKYQIIAVIDLTAPLGEVEADNARDAIEKAYDTLDVCAPGLCHQCSDEMVIGDVVRLMAQNADNAEDFFDEADKHKEETTS